METRYFDDTIRISNFSGRKHTIKSGRTNFLTINEVESNPSQKKTNKKVNMRFIKVDQTSLENSSCIDENFNVDDDDDILEINLENSNDCRKKTNLTFRSPKGFLDDESSNDMQFSNTVSTNNTKNEPTFQSSKRSNRADNHFITNNNPSKGFTNNSTDTSQSFQNLNQTDQFEINHNENKQHQSKNDDGRSSPEDRENENGASDPTQKEINIYPEPTAPQEKSNDFSNPYFDLLVYDTINFIQTVPPNDLMVRAKVIVDKGMFNQYAFYLEDKFGGYLLMKAFRKKTFKQHYYSISTANSDVPYKFGHLCSNYSRGEYILTGNYDGNDKLSEKKYFDVEYTTRMISSSKPKDLLGEVLLFDSEDPQSMQQEKTEKKKSLSSMFHREMKRSVCITTKKPYFDRRTNTYRLKFDGRVKMPSSNNLQLVDGSKPETTIFQIGKIKSKLYSCDFTYPFCAFSAFSMAVTCLSRT